MVTTEMKTIAGYNSLTTEALIAVYLRKSREDKDTDDTLRKHREELQEFINSKGFTNVVWFEEIGSGESFEGRPVFMELLPRIEDGEFAAVMVVHRDRLSRGSERESGILNEILEETNTLILTPQRTYDMRNEGDRMLSEFEGTISRNEYRAIKRRLIEGKKKAVKDGRLHSGNPPFGYDWDRNTKTAIVNEEEKSLYRWILQMFINDGISGYKIADILEDMNIPTPSGRGRWHGESVTSLLLNDFHRGYVWFGKYKAKKGRNEDGTKKKGIMRNPNPEDITFARGIHTPMKSEVEHAAVVKRIAENRTYNRRECIRKDTFRLSGLVYCPHCGKCQNINHPKGRNVHLRKCLKKSSTRTPECDLTVGLAEEVIFQAVIARMNEFHEELYSPSSDYDQSTANTMIDILVLQEKAIEKATKRIEKSKEMYKAELIEMDELKADIAKEEKEITKAKAKISELTESIDFVNQSEKERRFEIWESSDVMALLNGEQFSYSEINRILRSVIHTIEYERDGNDVFVKVKFR